MPPKKPPPGNPQWVDWVEELAHKTKEAGSKAYHSYDKAAKSLKAYPIEMNHPIEAQKLSGVGPGVVKYLLKKMVDHGKELGAPVSPQAAPKKRATAGTKKRKASDNTTSDDDAQNEAQDMVNRILASQGRILQKQPQDGFSGAGNRVGTGNDVQSGSSSPPPHPAKKAKTTRPYIPKVRSGAYAILLALYTESSYDEREKWVSKPDIMRVAGPFCDAPFDVTSVAKNGSHEKGNGNYTAWSSMKTLLGKNLVVDRNSRPQFYRLTTAGYETAASFAGKAEVALHVREPTSSSSNGQAPYRHNSNAGAFANGNGSSSAAKAGPGPKSIAHKSGPIFISDDEEEGDERENHYQPPIVNRKPTSFTRADPYASDSNDDEDARQLKRGLRESLRDSQANPSSSSGAGAADPAPLRTARPLPPLKDKPMYQPAAGVLDGRKAAQGGYGKVRIEPEKVANLGVDGPFGYHYLDENDNRLKYRKDAERGQEESHPFAATYRIEYRTCQDLHHLSRSVLRPSSLNRVVPLSGGSTKSGYFRERQAATECPGFIDSLTTSAAGGSSGSKVQTAAKKGASLDSLMNKGSYKATEKKDKQAMYAPPPGFGTNLSSDHDLPLPRSSSENSGLSLPSKAAAPIASTSTSSTSNSSRPAAGPAPKPSAFRPAAIANAVAGPSSIPVAKAAPVKQVPVPRPQASTSARPLARTTSTQQPLIASYDAVPNIHIINRHPLDPVRDIDPSDFVYEPFEPVVLKAGTFEIYLVVDHREVSGKSHGQRTELYDMLRAKGVRVERRGLPLGDFIWIAKRKGTYVADDQDVVMNAILERKRLDDLVGSVKDGRYVGQKVRMKDSAITDRTYLIENFNSANSYETFGKAIWTCKSQLQINDGFYVHETLNTAETLKYLIQRTEVMIDMYEDKDLHVIPDRLINRPTYLALQKHLRSHQPSRSFLTTYASFSNLNDNSTTKLSQIWATQISRVSGISAEKAGQVLGRWPTLYQFYIEARAHRAEIDAENERIDLEERRNQASGLKVKKVKRRKPEDFVVDSLPATDSTRAIKGKLGSKIYQLFLQSGKYSD